MAKAREIPGLDRDEPFAEGAKRVLEVRAAEVFDLSEGVLDTVDIERVHDMRVATRRLRAALELFRPVLPKRAAKRTLKEVKRVADALGGRRDLDVTIEELITFANGVPAPDRRGVMTLVEALREEQAAANEQLADHTTPEALASLRGSLDVLLAEL